MTRDEAGHVARSEIINNPAVVEFLNVRDVDRIERVEALVRRHLSSLGIPASFRRAETDCGQPAAMRVNGMPIEIGNLSGYNEQDLSELLRRRLAQIAGRRTILFVCTGNAIRSQIAESVVNHFLGDTWAAFSVGTMPLAVHADTIAVMREIGIDLSGRHSKHVDVFKDCTFDKVVILCADAGTRFPMYRYAGKVDRMHFDDPLSPDVLAGAILFNTRSQLRSLRDRMRKAIFAYLAGLE
jgi:arsenate reductase